MPSRPVDRRSRPAGLPEDPANRPAARITFDELPAFGEAVDGTCPAGFLEALDACGVTVDQPAGSDG